MLCGVNRGVGSRPRAGASLVGGYTEEGDGSKTEGAWYLGVGVDSLESLPTQGQSAISDVLTCGGGRVTRTVVISAMTDGEAIPSRLSNSGLSCKMIAFQRAQEEPADGG